ncbi:MAG: fumarylacetoacetate hydrolase family protein [Candidatus Thermoplasmatota archaeon]
MRRPVFFNWDGLTSVLKLATFAPPGASPRVGIVRGGWLLDAHAANPAVPASMQDLLANWDAAKPHLDGLAEACTDKSALHRANDVRILPPTEPGRYLDFYSFEGHVKNARAKRGLDVVPEWYQTPTYYNGNPYCFVGHGEPVRYPAGETQRDYEMELAVVLSRTCRNLDSTDWKSAIAGFTILNDCSARARQMPYAKVGMGPSYGKDFGKAIGPFIVTPEEVPDPGRIELATRVNGAEWSRGKMGEARYDWGAMLAFATKDQELRPGDVVGSGTFAGGCGYELDKFLQPGDVVEMDLAYDGKVLMTLRNPVV